MPYIKVNPEKLNSSAQSLKRIEGEINKTEEEFRYVSRQLDWKVSCEKDIDWILRKIDNELCEQSKVFGEMAYFWKTHRKCISNLSISIIKRMIEFLAL